MSSATTSDYQHHKFMRKVFYGDEWITYSSLFVALFTTLPPLTGGVVGEVDSGSTDYIRAEIAVGTGSWNENGLEYSNANDIGFPVPENAGWGTIVGAGLYDASTLGNLIYVAPLTASKAVNMGDGAPKIQTGQLRITRANCV